MRRVAPPIVAVYTLSGALALAYEVLWIRMLSLLFGVSIFGVVVTVAAFMAGLGSGSIFGARLVLSPRSAMRLFATLEGLIALYALALALLEQGIGVALAEVPDLGMWYAIQGGAAFFLLFVPAFAMGCGFPMILKAVRGHVSLATMYGMNTLGGVAGALLTLLLLPWLGWAVAVRTLAVAGLVLCAVSLFLARHAEGSEATGQVGCHQRPGLRFLLAYALIGAASLELEVAWTRLYGMLMLRTEYVVAVILAVFLSGIAIGSMLVRRTDGCRWLAYMPVLVATFVLISLYALPLLATWAEGMQADSLAAAMTKQGLAIALCTLPVTLMLGAWLPMLSRVIGSDGAGAWLYGANSVGAALGALATGFMLVPLLGTAATVCMAALLLFVAGMTWVENRQFWLALPLLVLLSLPVARLPDAATLLPRALNGAMERLRHEDAISVTHVVDMPDGQRLLLSDLHRMDASTDPTAVAIQKNQARLPMLLLPHARSVLFLGLGTGITASASLAYPRVQRTAVELSAGAIRAAASDFSLVNKQVMRRMHVIRDDARHFLSTHEAAYDLVIGDLFHPDMVGRSALLSVQQFERGRRHLSPDGLYVQWLALNQFDVYSMQVVLESFRHVFPDAVMFVDGFRLAMVSRLPARFSPAKTIHALQTFPDPSRRDATGDEGVWTWLGRFWGPVPRFPVPLQDEWAPVIEFSLPQARFRGLLDMEHMLSWLLRQRVSLALAAGMLHVGPEQRKHFVRAFAATTLTMRGELASLQGDEGRAQQLIRMAWEANPRDRWAGFSLADRMFAAKGEAYRYGYSEREGLRRILDVRPDHLPALRALLRLNEQEGKNEEVRILRQRIRALSPLGRVSG